MGERRTDSEEDAIDGEDESAVIETVADRLEGVEHVSGFAEVSQAPIAEI